MNRYELDGIAADVRKGRDVVIVGRLTMARQAFDQIVERDTEWEQIRRTNGAERATHQSGGSLALRSVGALRGRLADVLVVLGEDLLTRREHWELGEHVRAIRATRPTLELIRY